MPDLKIPQKDKLPALLPNNVELPNDGFFVNINIMRLRNGFPIHHRGHGYDI